MPQRLAPLEVYGYLPEKPGVYALRFGDCVYIGGTVNIRNRVRKHLTSLLAGTHTAVVGAAYASFGMPHASVLRICASRREALLCEAELIEELKPTLNGHVVINGVERYSNALLMSQRITYASEERNGKISRSVSAFASNDDVRKALSERASARHKSIGAKERTSATSRATQLRLRPHTVWQALVDVDAAYGNHRGGSKKLAEAAGITLKTAYAIRTNGRATVAHIEAIRAATGVDIRKLEK